MTDQELDQLLDSSLATYAGEPEPGLERRVMARIRRPRRWWFAGAAIAAAVLVWVALPDDPPIPPPPPLLATVPSVPVFPTAVAARKVVQRPAKPAGIPLSSQELELAKLMQVFPQIAKQLETPQDLSTPVTVAPLELAPIKIEPLETNAPGLN